MRAGGTVSRLRGVPLGEPLVGSVLWGAWAEVGGRPVLATGGDVGGGRVGRGGMVRLWDGLERVPLGEPLAGHVGAVWWGAWAEVGGRPVLATGGDVGVGGVVGVVGMVRLWDGLERVPLGEPLAGHAGAVLWGGWAEVGGRPVLATGDGVGGVRLWEGLERVPLGEPLAGHAGAVLWGAWAEVGGRPVLATAGDGVGTVRL